MRLNVAGNPLLEFKETAHQGRKEAHQDIVLGCFLVGLSRNRQIWTPTTPNFANDKEAKFGKFWGWGVGGGSENWQ